MAISYPALGAPQVAVLQALQACSQIYYDYVVNITDRDGGYLGQATVVKRLSSGQPTVANVSHDSAQNSPGTLNVVLSAPMTWGNIDLLLAPYLTISSPEYSNGDLQVFPLGLYVPTTPQFSLAGGTDVPVVCHDKIYFLQSDFPFSFYAPAGSTYTSMIADFLNAAGFTSALSGGDLNPAYVNFPLDLPSKLIPSGGLSFPFDDSNTYTFLDVINALLKACGCRPLYCDALGRFTIEYMPNPATQPQRWVFSGTASSYDPNFSETGGYTTPKDSVLSDDVWDVPNYFVFVQSGLTFQPVEGSGQYTVQNKAGEHIHQPPSDENSTGRFIYKGIHLSATSQADLVTQGDEIVRTSLSAASKLALKSAPWPAAAHYDVFQYVNSNLPNGSVRKVQAQQWTLDLNGGPMDWATQVVAFQ